MSHSKATAAACQHENSPQPTTRSKPAQPTLAVDTREPEGKGWEKHLTLPFERKALKTGDLSIVGLEDVIAVERKTIDDLSVCLSFYRDRFERELHRAQALDYFAVVIEADLPSLATGRYRSNMSANAAFESVVSMMVKFRVPFLFAGDPSTAARLAQSLLLKRLRFHTRISEGGNG
jgi:DNA excision repair protein ERCC-4